MRRAYVLILSIALLLWPSEIKSEEKPTLSELKNIAQQLHDCAHSQAEKLKVRIKCSRTLQGYLRDFEFETINGNSVVDVKKHLVHLNVRLAKKRFHESREKMLMEALKRIKKLDNLLSKRRKRGPVCDHTHAEEVLEYSKKQGSVIITLDDWASNETVKKYLSLLDEKDVRALMFLTGKYSSNFESLKKRICEEGHIIANHTWSHRNLTELSKHQIRTEIKQGFQGSKLLRLPYGAGNDKVRSVADNLGYEIVPYDIDPKDWKPNREPDEIVTEVMQKVDPGDIILLHLNGPNTLKALSDLIERLRKKGLKVGLKSTLKER